MVDAPVHGTHCLLHWGFRVRAAGGKGSKVRKDSEACSSSTHSEQGDNSLAEEQVHVISLQPIQRCLDAFLHVLAVQAPVVGPGATIPEEKLCGENDVAALPAKVLDDLCASTCVTMRLARDPSSVRECSAPAQ